MGCLLFQTENVKCFAFDVFSNPFAFRKAKIVYNFGLSEWDRVKLNICKQFTADVNKQFKMQFEDDIKCHQDQISYVHMDKYDFISKNIDVLHHCFLVST